MDMARSFSLLRSRRDVWHVATDGGLAHGKRDTFPMDEAFHSASCGPDYRSRTPDRPNMGLPPSPKRTLPRSRVAASRATFTPELGFRAPPAGPNDGAPASPSRTLPLSFVATSERWNEVVVVADFMIFLLIWCKAGPLVSPVG